MIVIVMIGGI